MFSKFLSVYKFYLLISLIVAVLVILSRFPNLLWFDYFLVFLGSFLTPLLYELDFLIYTYILEPESTFSKNMKTLLSSKRYKAAFIYAHEHSTDISFSVFKSILVVLGVFAITFILIFTPNPSLFSLSIVFSFLLTSIYLQIISLYKGDWHLWYSTFDTSLNITYYKLLLLLQVLVFIFFLVQIF